MIVFILCIINVNTTSSSNFTKINEGHLVKYIYYDMKQVYILYNQTRLPIWNADTFNDMGFDWGKINFLPRYVMDTIKDGDKLDIYDNDNYIKNKESIKQAYINRLVEPAFDFSDNMLSLTSNEMMRPETLIIIVGQYRTFGETCIR